MPFPLRETSQFMRSARWSCPGPSLFTKPVRVGPQRTQSHPVLEAPEERLEPPGTARGAPGTAWAAPGTRGAVVCSVPWTPIPCPLTAIPTVQARHGGGPDRASPCPWPASKRSGADLGPVQWGRHRGREWGPPRLGRPSRSGRAASGSYGAAVGPIAASRLSRVGPNGRPSRL